MTDDEKSVSGEVDDNNTDYIAAINELKQNSVDRSKYEQLRADNKRLLDSIVNGQTIEIPASKPKPDITELKGFSGNVVAGSSGAVVREEHS